jgi:hypothetical protein
VDKDNRESAGAGIVFNRERYAIENLALDPLILGAFLLREGKVSSSELGLPAGLRHFDLTKEHAQAVVDAMSGKVAKDDSDMAKISVKYLGGFNVSVPAFWLNTKGHDLEMRVVEVHQSLRSFGKNLDLSIISKGFGDLLDFVPYSVVNMLSEILAAQ